jgi:hypothetical protein
LDRTDDAVHQLETAITTSERIGALVFATQARSKLADCLETRGRREDRHHATQLRQQANTAMHALGIRPIFQPATTDRRPQPTSAVLRREGDYWTIQHSTDPIRIRNRLGMHYLARLLTEPGREFHVLDLAAGPAPEQHRASPGLGPILDEKAKAAYRSRLTELTEERHEAEAFGDPARTETTRG